MVAPEIDSADGVKVGGITLNSGAISGVTTPLSVAQGGTGVSGDTYDADKVDGCHAGTQYETVFLVPDGSQGNILYFNADYDLVYLGNGVSGYQLTTYGSGANPAWAAASDLIFSDTHCPKCGAEFQDGDDIILHIIGHNEVGDILTIPMHLSCANHPKKTVTIKRRVMEDQHVLDEDTGWVKVQRVQKMKEKTVTKYRLKDGYILDNTTGKAHKLGKDGKLGNTKYNLSEVLETAEEIIHEILYEDAEYTL